MWGSNRNSGFATHHSSGAKAIAPSSCIKTASSMRQCCRSFGPHGQFDARLRPVSAFWRRREAFRCGRLLWLEMGPVSESKVFPRESSAWKLPLLPPIDSASPKSRFSTRDDPTHQSEFERGRTAVQRKYIQLWFSVCHTLCGGSARSRGPAPVTNFRHVFAMLTDIELVVLHRRPVPRGRLV